MKTMKHVRLVECFRWGSTEGTIVLLAPQKERCFVNLPKMVRYDQVGAVVAGGGINAEAYAADMAARGLLVFPTLWGYAAYRKVAL